jgi:hypothetical protein
MFNRKQERIKTAVVKWAHDYYGADDVVVYLFDDEDGDPERVIAVLAVRGLEEWQAVEVWLEGNKVASINELGEGVPPEDVVWPWSD